MINVLYSDGRIEEKEYDDAIKVARHTASHVLAQAVKKVYPEARLAIGPATDDGFYYDFDNLPITENDLKKLENIMRNIISEKQEMKVYEVSRAKACEMMKDEPYKLELIHDLPEDATITMYENGPFVDMCAGPHLTNTGDVGAIKLMSTTGAYWRGSEKNKMLTRIYGICYKTEKEIEDYLTALEEAKARDHRKLGKELNIFMMNDLVGKGLPMYLPNGYTVWEILENYIKRKERKLDYKHVLTPPLATVDLYKTSGHWEHYKDNMFPKMEVEGEEFVLRPMNCPHHMMIYANKMHSYRDLPIRIGEVARDCRFESSGTLKGIERVRTFCQNDAHLFVTPEQIESEFKSVVDLILEVYKELNITNYRFELSLRDPEDKVKYHPDDEMWNSAENTLRQVLNDIGIEYEEKIGEAAFYGPKLDVQVKPAVGAEYTLSTCQLDFCLPMKFNLSYIDKDGSKKTPVVLHRAILGSIDRFIAYYLEETKGALPTWLSPVQIKLLTINDNMIDYAKTVKEKLEDNDIRVELDDSNEKLGYKIRNAKMEKVPYFAVIGAKEIETNTLSIKNRKDEEIKVTPDELVQKILEECKIK